MLRLALRGTLYATMLISVFCCAATSWLSFEALVVDRLDDFGDYPGYFCVERAFSSGVQIADTARGTYDWKWGSFGWQCTWRDRLDESAVSVLAATDRSVIYFVLFAAVMSTFAYGAVLRAQRYISGRSGTGGA